MDNYKFSKYESSIDTFQDKLKKYGVAIIPNVLNEKEIKNFQNGIWDYLEHLTKNFEEPINRNNESSWRSLRDLFPLHSMLIQHWNIGHAQFNWDIRQNSKVINVFAKLWNVKPDELVTSFDGASVHLPPEVTNLGWYKGNDWFHCDQSFMRNDFECVQTWVTAYDVNEGDATLAFLEKSHKYHKNFKDDLNITEKADWYKLKTEEIDYYLNKKCNKTFIKCPAGSMVLWDSRTIHCGRECKKERVKPNFRGVSYVCMKPRNLSTEKDLEKKRKAFEELRTTSHWPNKVKLFSKTPRTYGKDLPDINLISKPKVSKLGMKLAGY
tara:strand:+ start:106 stop:1077 length:972 start_codon:yes stop_codon:yes gene_type:complete